jgi:hypothetical protein
MKVTWVGRLQGKGKNLGESVLGSCPDVGFCNMVSIQNRTMGPRMELFVWQEDCKNKHNNPEKLTWFRVPVRMELSLETKEDRKKERN